MTEFPQPVSPSSRLTYGIASNRAPVALFSGVCTEACCQACARQRVLVTSNRVTNQWRNMFSSRVSCSVRQETEPKGCFPKYIPGPGRRGRVARDRVSTFCFQDAVRGALPGTGTELARGRDRASSPLANWSPSRSPEEILVMGLGTAHACRNRRGALFRLCGMVRVKRPRSQTCMHDCCSSDACRRADSPAISFGANGRIRSWVGCEFVLKGYPLAALGGLHCSASALPASMAMHVERSSEQGRDKARAINSDWKVTDPGAA